ncbi:MAG: HD-GYP domain-containing protein [Porticoccaceae bacterium]|nr:MAG: HD-GYP domain-containing protein [Porticoccaceae bacterium]
MVDNFGSDKKSYARENLVKIPVGQVEIGMFVGELDRPWLGTPFLLQGFEVRSKSQIRSLAEYCQHVYVLKDGVPLKGPEVPVSRTMPPPPKKNVGTLLPMQRSRPGRAPQVIKPLVRARPAYEVLEPVRYEHAGARNVLDAGRVNVKGLLKSAQMGQMLDTEAAESVVDSCVGSILRNPEALLWMTKIKDMNEYTAEHCLNVCVLAIAFGRHLRMSEEELRLLGLCGLLHDVGKMRIPSEILDKPGRLTQEEFAIMKQHTVVGYELLQEQSTSLNTAALDVALNHHERPDRGGYPRGLGERELTEFSRIIAVVDAYDAITSNRCYAPALPSAEAQKIIFENRGTQFDEAIALQFIQAIGPYPPGTLVELRNGMAGIVLAGKVRFRHLPTVLLLRDANKQPMEERTVELDLTDTGTLSKEFLVKRTLPDGSFGISLRECRVQHEPVFL